MNNQLAETQQAPRGIAKWFAQEKVQERIGSALGGWMSSKVFCAQMEISLQHDNLKDCTDQSKFEAAHLCAAMMMLPSLGQVALIPRKINKGKHNEMVVCTVMPQWQGFQALMLRNEEVLDVTADLVHVNDRYHFDATLKQIEHDYDPFDERRKIETFDDIRGGYLVVTWRDPNRPRKVHIVKRETMIKARDCSQDYKYNASKGTAIWDLWFEEQALKTIYRNAYSRRAVPIDPLVARHIESAVSAEDQALDNDPSLPGRQGAPITLESQAVPRVENRSRSEILSESMGGQSQRPDPEPAGQDLVTEEHQGQFESMQEFSDAIGDPYEISPEDLEEAQQHATGVEPRVANRRAMKKNPLYRFMKSAIEDNDPVRITEFIEHAEVSLEAGEITEDIYNVWREQAEVAREQCVPH